tara:strand:+ start:531 stop:1160 length:630 start_codon:yes stop_codon:yes gene_type:complete
MNQFAVINEVQDVSDNKDVSIKNGELIIDFVASSNVVELKQDKNSFEKVKFRENVLKLENDFVNMIKDGVIDSTLEDCILTHHFSPVDEKYGCGTYAREMFIPKDTLIIGKIHRHQHLNFIMKGKVSVATEFGKKYFEAPCIFVSEVGLKRAVYAEEDTIWVTVHLTEHSGEENLSKIEEEVIAPNYEEMNLIASTSELSMLENKGETL